jgi:class 3 adenylate cyclase
MDDPKTTNLPGGTVTFLFTDIESSARLAREQGEGWETLRARHNALLRSAVESARGALFKEIGDATCSAFHTARDAVDAALQVQRTLQSEAWAAPPIRVRMGLHTGEADPEDGDYTGYLTLTRVQRLMALAHGAQILASNSSAELLRAQLPDGAKLKDLGQHRLRNLPDPERIWQVVAPGLRQDFPPLASSTEIPNNLPAIPSSFVGREQEIVDVRGLLQAHRLVTLAGAGGSGKTRLALEAARAVLHDFEGGAWFIELASLADGSLVPDAAASALALRKAEDAHPTPILLDWLSDREALLIFDNCEHLVEDGAALASAILQGGAARPGPRDQPRALEHPG